MARVKEVEDPDHPLLVGERTASATVVLTEGEFAAMH